MKRIKPGLTKSVELFKRAEHLILNGTQLYSKMPSVGVLGVSPLYFVRGQGSHAWDLEGNEYIDLTMGLGPCILGYNHPAVREAVLKQFEIGAIFSLPHPIEVECAERIHEVVPCAEMMRFLKTGSEAVQAAARIARAYTGREKIIKGHYHGWHEWCITGTPRDGGVPKVYRDYSLEVHYNRLDECEEYFRKHPGEIAAVVMEPIEFEAPRDGFLENMKELCHRNGALLVFDEVVTGFRYSIGGAQKHFGVIPDIAAFGKGMGSGLPISCVAGRREVFEGAKDKIFVSSTFGGETLSLAACIATIDVMKAEPVHERLWVIGDRIRDGFNARSEAAGSAMRCVGLGPRLGFDFKPLGDSLPEHLKTLLMQEVVKRGVFFVWNMLPSCATSDQDIADVLGAFEESLAICTKAEKEGTVRSLLEGAPPITVI
jgi:glutamate-1-semialdehyde 2,1-aminomutase